MKSITLLILFLLQFPFMWLGTILAFFASAFHAGWMYGVKKFDEFAEGISNL